MIHYVLSFVFTILQIYLMDIHIWYTLLSALVGGVMGARDRLGEVYIYRFGQLKCFINVLRAFQKRLLKTFPLQGS
jgi:hypothetical protein